MSITAYEGILQEEIKKERKIVDGRSYTLNHPDDIVIDMKYFGGSKNSGVNAQGWERSRSVFFKELLDRHPEYFSKFNTMQIKSGKSPIVDNVFIKHFPQFKKYAGETMIHHHIGGDGQGVVVPESYHKGYGGIHNIEKEVGIRDNAEKFSKKTAELAKEDSTVIGKTSGEIKTILEKKEMKLDARETVVKPQHKKLSLDQWKKGISESSRAISKSAEKLIEAPVKGVGLVR